MELAQSPSKKSPSLVYDEAAKPAERSEHLDSLDQTIRPSAIVEERHADTTLDCNAAHALAFKDFGTLKVQTGSSFGSVEARIRLASAALHFFPACWQRSVR